MRAASVLTALAFVGAAACAAVTCQPASIVVAGKEERTRLREQVSGLRTTPTGSVEEVRRGVHEVEYWVKAADGTSYRVSPEQCGAATPGQPLEVCR